MLPDIMSTLNSILTVLTLILFVLFGMTIAVVVGVVMIVSSVGKPYYLDREPRGRRECPPLPK